MSLFRARYPPFNAPCLAIACSAYLEQVGVNRQLGGNMGLRICR